MCLFTRQGPQTLLLIVLGFPAEPSILIAKVVASRLCGASVARTESRFATFACLWSLLFETRLFFLTLARHAEDLLAHPWRDD